MSNFDSEADRRDYERKKIIDRCMAFVAKEIQENGPTQTPTERRWLEVNVARRILDGIHLEVTSAMYCEEIAAAKKFDGAVKLVTPWNQIRLALLSTENDTVVAERLKIALDVLDVLEDEAKERERKETEKL